MLKKILSYIFIFTILCSGNTNAKLFDGEEFYLDNGMRVIVIPNHKAPIVGHMVWYKIGAMDDPSNKAGIAHLLEHLMFKGTKRVKDFDRIITENGGNGNAMTSYDYTAYHQNLDISKLELAMFLEADRMKNLVFNQTEFLKERDVVFNERKQVVENNPASEFAETFRRNLYQNHPYARPVIGTATEIMGLTLDDAKAFYKTHYTPNNAILILSGDIDIPTAKTLANKYYGKISTPPIVEEAIQLNKTVKDTQNSTSVSTTSFTMRLPNIQNSRYQRTYVTDNKNYALVILAKYLGDGKTSELYKTLVLNKKALINISTGYNGTNRGPGSFTISALLKNEKDPTDQITKEMDFIIKKMTEKDLEKTKEKLLSGLIFLKDNPFDAARIVGQMSITMSFDEINSWSDNINAVTLNEVKEAYKALQTSTNQTGLLLPQN